MDENAMQPTVAVAERVEKNKRISDSGRCDDRMNFRLQNPARGGEKLIH
jgi:hypothetical protein